MSIATERARRAFLRACALDVLVRKPGNVSVHSAGHGMHAALFFASAEAAAGPLFETGARVGERIEAAMRATWAVAGCNTNLGILLLCAPLALAVEREPDAATSEELRAAVVRVLADLDRADAAAAYRAIALANPGGLGTAAEQDVHDEPAVDLRTAMAMAADRDSIAAQYRDGYALVFETVLPALGAAFDAVPDGAPDARTVSNVQRAFLALLSTVPDSHITRKRGPDAATAVMHQARAWHERAATGASLDGDAAFLAWDAALKADAINPGTSADLLVAAMMLAHLSASVPKRDAA
jgi:triphosphoribosyl-dephospho-CoA synthase